jgi:hypothetical protein
MNLLSELVRSPNTLIERASGPEYAARVPQLVAIVLGCGTIFGAEVGSHHSAWQAIFAAVKMPWVLLPPTLLAGAAMHALCDVVGLQSSFRRATVAGLVTMARVGVLVVSIAPVHWLACAVVHQYRFTALSTAAVLVSAGLFGIGALCNTAMGFRSAKAGPQLVVLAGSVLLYGATTAQAGWLLRPFILRPHLPALFIEAPESDIFTELGDRIAGRPPRQPPAKSARPAE